MNPDDPLEQLMALKAKQATQPDPLDELMKSKAAKPKIGQMGHAIAEEASEDPSYAQQALGGVAALAHDIPGAEAAQAGVRSLIRRQPYTEALSDIRGAEHSANKWVRRYNSALGGTMAAAATPGSNVALQGARFGVAEALGSADPESLKDRIDAIPVRAGINAAAGKVFGELVPNAARMLGAKSLGKNVLNRTAKMEAADIPAYGKAKVEGDLAAANPTPAAVSSALNDPDIQPYVKVIRGSGVFRGADDATVLREAYKLMTERERALGTRIVSSDDYKAGSELEKQEITSGKKRLLTAADEIMPSFRPATQGHAQAESGIEAVKSAADATKRILNGGDVPGKNLGTKSPEAFMATILKARQAEAKAMREGVLGKLQKKTGLSSNPLKAFGVPKALYKVGAMGPYLNALDSQAGDAELPLFMRAAGIGVGSNIGH